MFKPNFAYETSRRNRKPRASRRTAVSTLSSIRCCSPNTLSRCSVRSLPNDPPKHRREQLANRLTKILAETRKLNPAG